MIMLRRAQKLNQFLLQSTKHRTIPTLSSLLRDSPRHFSTDIQTQSHSQSQPQPQPQSQSPSSTPVDFFRPPPQSQGSVYGRIFGFSLTTLKTDIINVLGGCNLTLDDIKVDYNRMFYPVAILVKFDSMSEFTGAIRELARKNRSLRMEKLAMDQQNWDHIKSYNGHYVVFRGIPRNAQMDDVERMLCGLDYDGSSLEIFSRAMEPEPIRMALVGFHSRTQAVNAVIRKNGALCLNSQIEAQLLQ